MENNQQKIVAMKQSTHRNLLLFLLLSTASVGLAQTVADGAEVKGVSDLKVESSQKISENPSFEDSVKIKSELKYGMVERKAPSVFVPKAINAPKLGTDKTAVPKMYNGLMKVGLIDFTTLPVMELTYGSKYSKDYVYTINVDHFASDLRTAASSKTNPARNTETGIQASGKRFLKTYTLFGDFSYNYNTRRYYGSDYGLDTLNPDLLKQYFGIGHLQGGFKSNYRKESDLHHKVTFDYYNIFDAFNMQENRISVTGNVAPTVAGYKGNVDAAVDWFTASNNAGTKSSWLVQVSPGVHFKGDRYTAKVGINTYVLVTDSTRGHIYPFAEGEYALIKDVFMVYAKYRGYFERYDYLRHIESNPFFGTSSPLTNTSHLNNVFGGIKGNISSKITFNTGIEFDKMKNLPLYINDNASFGNRLFTVAVDDVTMFRYFGQLSWDMQKIQLSVKGDYRSYTAFHEVKAWHLPAVEIGFSGRYNFQDMVFAKVDVYYLGEQFARGAYDGTTYSAEKLPGIVDANIGIEYKYNKRISAFLNVNNMLNKQYRRWNQYPGYGINFLGGFTYAF
ncbi:MAG: hypothetical protein NT150_08360 [Bacteroidetes bacterium]|nr:hypothetical protein [Bacteroidota bacterium]